MESLTAPSIPTWTAHAFAAFFTFSYVGSLYVSSRARLSFKKDASQNVHDGQERAKESDERWRNDPDVIRARLLSASLSTMLNIGVVYWLIRSVKPGSQVSLFLIISMSDVNVHDASTALSSTLTYLGVTAKSLRSSPVDIILPCLIAPVLFLGPLYADYLCQVMPFQRLWSFRNSVLPVFTTWIGLRNHVVGPITEEVVFRACMLAVYHMAGASHKKMIFLSPLWFGVAHLHHAWDTYNRFGRTSSAIRIAVMQTLFQLAYTSLFGFHCAYLFLRTGSLLPPAISHVFCNVMGFPQYALHIRMFPNRRRAIQAAYVLGIAGYIYTVRAWTRTDDSTFWPTPGQSARY
ncbi:hypothetical protein C8Q80DRAFT_1093736 [Daedaleopsis nitida]|nr:hypothetical protein C8Q80DRAFT_1093736 [Daedaleopsis nitida]